MAPKSLASNVSPLPHAERNPPTADAATSDNMESESLSVIHLQSLRASYNDGRRAIAAEIGTARRLGTLPDRAVLVGRAHAADVLARAFAPINPESSAWYRGRADVLASEAKVIDSARGLAGCVERCPTCGGQGHGAAGAICLHCGGAGACYSPGKLSALARARLAGVLA